MMKVRSYLDAREFLNATRSVLESQEALNSLMLGVCEQLIHQPGIYQTTPYLKTVSDSTGLVCAAVMTPPHQLILYSHQGDFDLAATRLIKKLLDDGWKVPGVIGPTDTSAVFGHAWSQLAGGRVEILRRLKLFELCKVMLRTMYTGVQRRTTSEDLELITGWWYAFKAEIQVETDIEELRDTTQTRINSGDIYLWVHNDQPVSMAMKTRPTRNGISVSLVYTPPEYRRQGYASACVTALSQMLLNNGWKFCTLFADSTNHQAINLYERIGYMPICGFDEYRFIKS